MDKNLDRAVRLVSTWPKWKRDVRVTKYCKGNTMITEFQGEYRWLSNFAPCEITIFGRKYKSTEAAYQAMKTIVPEERIPFEAMNAAQAKKAGRKLTLRTDWDAIKLDVMTVVTAQKYHQEPYQSLLLATGDQKIIEGNYWNDTYWGVCRGVGENNLGKIIMEMRDILND